MEVTPLESDLYSKSQSTIENLVHKLNESYAIRRKLEGEVISINFIIIITTIMFFVVAAEIVE